MLLIDAMLNYTKKQEQERKAPATQRASEALLARFAGSLGEAANFLEMDELRGSDVSNFLYRNPDASPATFNRERSVLTSFLQYAGSGHLIADIPPMKNPQKPNLILSPEEMLKMLDRSNPVERIALALGMNTGLRASDISSLRVGDVDLATGYITCAIQKTGVTDRKPITMELMGELERWYEAYATSCGGYVAENLNNSWYLVPSYTVTPQKNLLLRPEQPLGHMHRLVQRALNRVALPTEGQGFHTLRRSSARALFERLRKTENADHALLVVREFLNHQSVTQTERYLGINAERTIRDEQLRGRSFLSPPTWVQTAPPKRKLFG